MAFIEGAWLTEGRWVGYAVLLVCAYKVKVSPRLGFFSGVALWGNVRSAVFPPSHPFSGVVLCCIYM